MAIWLARKKEIHSSLRTALPGRSRDLPLASDVRPEGSGGPARGRQIDRHTHIILYIGRHNIKRLPASQGQIRSCNCWQNEVQGGTLIMHISSIHFCFAYAIKMLIDIHNNPPFFFKKKRVFYKSTSIFIFLYFKCHTYLNTGEGKTLPGKINFGKNFV